MKYLQLVLSIMIISLFSCVQEDQENDGNRSEVLVDMKIDTRADTDELAKSYESQIRSIRIYAFDGSTFDRSYYFPIDSIINGSTTPPFLVKVGTNKQIYVVVNEPLDVNGNTYPLFNNLRRISDLETLNFNFSDLDLGGNLMTMTDVEKSKIYLPMTGNATGVVVTEGVPNQSIIIPVTRSVARVDVYMKNTRTSATIYYASNLAYSRAANDINIWPSTLTLPSGGQYSGGSQFPETSTARVISKTDNLCLYSYYISERLCGTSIDPFNIDLSYSDGTTPVTSTFSVGNDSENSSGNPLNKFIRNTVYRINVSLVDESSDIEDELTICPWTIVPTQIEEVATNINMVNCYMVTPGRAVLIPVRDVYKIWATNQAFAKTPIPSGTVTAKLIWQDGLDSLGNLKPVIPTDGISVNYDAENPMNSYIVVQTQNAGNAVVAMTIGNDSKVYWSWHIWCTSYNPNYDNQTISLWAETGYSTSTLMNRDLGALAYNSNPGDNALERGLLYQYGRKDPFPTADAWGTTDRKVYDISGSQVNISFPSTTSLTNPVAEAVNNPFSFIINAADGEWCPNYEGRTTLWETEKRGLFDPCPAGWHVPPHTFAAELNRSYVFYSFSDAITGFTKGIINSKRAYFIRKSANAKDNVYFPVTYFRSGATGALVSATAAYWVVRDVTDSSYGGMYNVIPTSGVGDYKDYYSMDAASGNAIRCVRYDY